MKDKNKGNNLIWCCQPSAISIQSRPGGIGFMCISLKAER